MLKGEIRKKTRKTRKETETFLMRKSDSWKKNKTKQRWQMKDKW